MFHVLNARVRVAVAMPAWMAMRSFAQETVCASVKIQIKQQLTPERQAFEAEMKINNTTDSGVISNVSVVVKVMEENGTPVSVTEDPNASGAKFFIAAATSRTGRWVMETSLSGKFVEFSGANVSKRLGLQGGEHAL